jgi:hypothetical protein
MPGCNEIKMFDWDIRRIGDILSRLKVIESNELFRIHFLRCLPVFEKIAEEAVTEKCASSTLLSVKGRTEQLNWDFFRFRCILSIQRLGLALRNSFSSDILFAR